MQTLSALDDARFDIRGYLSVRCRTLTGQQPSDDFVRNRFLTAGSLIGGRRLLIPQSCLGACHTALQAPQGSPSPPQEAGREDSCCAATPSPASPQPPLRALAVTHQLSLGICPGSLLRLRLLGDLDWS